MYKSRITYNIKFFTKRENIVSIEYSVSLIITEIYVLNLTDAT